MHWLTQARPLSIIRPMKLEYQFFISARMSFWIHIKIFHPSWLPCIHKSKRWENRGKCDRNPKTQPNSYLNPNPHFWVNSEPKSVPKCNFGRWTGCIFLWWEKMNNAQSLNKIWYLADEKIGIYFHGPYTLHSFKPNGKLGQGFCPESGIAVEVGHW